MLSVLAALAVAPIFVQDQPKNGLAFSTELKTLVVFKEGFGFYVREGKAQLEDGWATTNLVPRAIRGTLWMYPTAKDDRVDTVVMTNDNQLEFKDKAEISALLKDKVGLPLSIATEGRTVQGELSSLLPTMMLLKDAQKNYIALEYAKVETITLVGYPVRVKLTTAKPNGVAGIGMAYIQEGIRWEPSYLLELQPGKQGRLTLRGTLLNLDEDLKNTDVVFVVGAPLIANRGQLDSFLIGMMPGLASGGLGGPGGGLGQGRDSQSNRPAPAGRGGGGFGGNAGEDFEAGGALPAAESGELHYYTKPKLRLRPGDRAMASIFEVTVPVTSSFEWNADTDELYYLLNIKNTSKQPLTTGPVFVVEDQRPVGQQQIKYTPAGGSGELRLAAGIGLRVKKQEVEVRRGEVVKIGETQFLPITLKGTLTLENFRAEAADVKVRRQVNGKVLEVKNGGAIEYTSVNPGDPNASNVVEWKISVPSGGKLDLEYSYEVFSVIRK
ncbi:MAG: hypothetical protein HZC36_12215 [Armatimonadetes bacterium]|nr:hypothetical protein [Armatimonadota bacterium]